MERKVAILLGSKNDMKFVEPSEAYFKHFNVNYEVHIMSAHRTPAKVAEFAGNARDNGYFLLVGKKVYFFKLNWLAVSFPVTNKRLN